MVLSFVSLWFVLWSCMFYDAMAFDWREEKCCCCCAIFPKPQSFRFHHYLSSVLSASWCCCGLSHNLTFFHGWYSQSICSIHAFLHSPFAAIQHAFQFMLWRKKSQFKWNYSPSFFSSRAFFFCCSIHFDYFSVFYARPVMPLLLPLFNSSDEHLQLRNGRKRKNGEKNKSTIEWKEHSRCINDVQFGCNCNWIVPV